MSPRLFCTIFLIVSACAFPLVFTAAIGLFSAIWFRDYYEILPIAFLSDALYGLPMARFHSFPYVMTLLAAALVCVVSIVRRRLLATSLRTI